MIAAPCWAAAADYTGKPFMFMGIMPLIGIGLCWLFLIPNCSFGLALVIASLVTICLTATSPMLDAMCLKLLRGNREYYGRQRLWGAVSSGVAYMMTNGIQDHVTTSLPVIAFSIQTTFAACFIATIWMYKYFVQLPVIPSSRDVQKVQIKQASGKSKAEGYNATTTIESPRLFATHSTTPSIHPPPPTRSYTWLTTPDFLIFLCVLCTLGAPFIICQSFAWLYTSTTLHASNTLLGLMGVFSIIIELPFFFASKHIVSFFGYTNAIFVAGLAMVIRLVGYTLVTEATQWWVLAVEVIHGFAYSLMWVSAVQYANDCAPEGMKVFAQGLVVAINSGLSSALGGIVGGVVNRRWGYGVMFRSAAVFVGVATVGYGMVNLVVGRVRRGRREGKEDVENVGRD
ncbi:hypothetical protein HDV00_004384 [Rhizophlyctis rosea]|nr:hypothetical protein HDV00_004384 [Rhizophlyctis rosea]